MPILLTSTLTWQTLSPILPMEITGCISTPFNSSMTSSTPSLHTPATSLKLARIFPSPLLRTSRMAVIRALMKASDGSKEVPE